MSNNSSISSGAAIFQQKMMFNKQKMSSFNALRKVANNMIGAQNSKITALDNALKDINIGENTPDIKLSKLLDIYTNISNELSYFEGYNQQIKNDKNYHKLSDTIKVSLDEIKNHLSNIKSEMIQTTIVKSISSLISNTVPSLINMKVDISELVDTFNNNPNIIQAESYKSKLKEYENKKNIINDSLLKINNWLDQYAADEHTEKLYEYKNQLVIIQDEINKSELSYLMVKEIEAEFMSEDGLMQAANHNLTEMNTLIKILDENLKKYKAEPNKFGAKYNFSGDTGKFRVINPANPFSNVAFHPSKNDYDNFIESFTQECVALKKIENIYSAGTDQILKMEDELLTIQTQLNDKLKSYHQRVNELKYQIPANIIEEANNKTAENLVNVMAERHEKDLVSSTGNARHTDGTHLAIIPVEMNG